MADTTGEADIRKAVLNDVQKAKPQEDWKIREKGGRFSK